MAGKKATGRTGSASWPILVMSLVQLGLAVDSDRMENMAHHPLVRQKLGVRGWASPVLGVH